MRMFKKKVSDVIDDILTKNLTPQNQTPTSNTSMTSRPQTAFSNYIHIITHKTVSRQSTLLKKLPHKYATKTNI